MALNLVVIVGSVRNGRYGPHFANWFAECARRHGSFDVDVVDLVDVTLPAALPAGPEESGRSSAMAGLARRLDDADAFVVVTPEYNHSYPASIKHLVDWHSEEWRAKPVGFVSYGGMGGLRAVEHLRQVFVETHSVPVRDQVGFDRHWSRLDEDGNLLDADGADAAAKTLLDQLAWWAGVLHDAREKTPYTVS
ncbi:NADPH-dependent oxidoreductase [Actinomadura spongiicola]|uniref:NADPH-dependent oxidoreductase n=1 Tax=Actinomadura spongiicola TaxID=2303421 RepID=A0A372GCM2_9ACTN|nr:NAD(P)H-dependent oxidoreductase [Actinomadura spongiicola]RFS82879.1 NADPH-dependent oxidoreductase [Actinomadura spongiicola]